MRSASDNLMMKCADPAESCRSRAFALSALARRVGMFLLVLGAAAFSQETRERTISNLSASISSPASSTAESVSHPVDSDAKDSAAMPAPRLIGRRSAKTSGEILRGASNGPWYQTGLGSLAIVLALIGGAYWVVRRWMPSVRSADVGALRVVARASLAQRQSIVLVQIGRRLAVLALSPGRVDKVCDISDPQEVAELTGQDRSGEPRGPATFDKTLRRAAEDFSAADRETGAADHTSVNRGLNVGAVSGLLKRLRALQQSN